MSGDLIVYALVAAGLVFWLKSVLGTRHGDERERHNPYTGQSINIDDNVITLTRDGDDEQSESAIENLAKNPTDILSIENKTAEQGLLEIAELNKGFDIHHFLNGAQDAFAIIVEAFGEGDEETLSNLLAEPVFKAFKGAIDERREAGNTLDTEIHAIKKAEVIEAFVEQKIAYITVRFVARETSVEKDSLGEILSGHPDKVTEMRDIWVFGQKIRARDPRWLVHETRGDFEGDNDIIPDTESHDKG